jgi:acetyl esterase/lipase
VFSGASGGTGSSGFDARLPGPPRGIKMLIKKSWLAIPSFFLLAITLWLSAGTLSNAQLLRPQDVANLPSSPADHRIRYGSDPLQFADLRLPKTGGPHPVAVVIHGGCWITNFADLQIMAAMSDALTKSGVATWNIEYRRVDSPGGGWPGSFLDIANAVDHLRKLANPYRLDLKRVIVLGHSAGGHLALWAAARHRLPGSSPLFKADALRLHGAINIAGPGNLKSMLPLQQRVCGDAPITKLVGGSPDEVAERYRDASPAEMLPLGIEQILITGTKDRAVPPELGKEYEEAARRKGDKVRMIDVEGAGHFEVIAPGTPAWKSVEDAVLALLKIRGLKNSKRE